MRFLKFLIILTVAGSAVAGSSSVCEPLKSSYKAFLQVFEDSLEGIEQFTIGKYK
jgi:hypothetical protein